MQQSKTTTSGNDASPSVYNRVPAGEEATLVVTNAIPSTRFTFFNFVAMSVLFSANHGCTVACLALATARLGRVGAWQSGTLYLTYTASAVMGATYIVKRLGSRNSIIVGMCLYCIYVGCFWVATLMPMLEIPSALLGAAIGGVGGGFLWTAQGAYFAKAAQEHASIGEQGASLQESSTSSTSLFAGVFAFIYLSEEVALRALSTALLALGIQWGTIFGVYTLVAVVSTVGMVWIYNYPIQQEESSSSSDANTNLWYKVTAAWQLLRTDPKMKHMIGLNAVFGFSSAFMNSYVNGEMVRVALGDSKNVGVLSALVAAVAAVCSLLFARLAQTVGKGPVLIVGAMAFLWVGFIFIIVPNIEQHWGWGLLVLVYTLQGVGRSTFESTLKAIFADYFPEEKEGAFANIILQNGLSSSIGFFLSFRLACKEASVYCVEYQDGTLHNVLKFELLVVITAIVAILGYWRASVLFHAQQQEREEQTTEGETELLENEQGVSA